LLWAEEKGKKKTGQSQREICFSGLNFVVLGPYIAEHFTSGKRNSKPLYLLKIT
jgi:hypothetical protein